jgi:cytoskeletal protein CcmA (bactofilin family)
MAWGKSNRTATVADAPGEVPQAHSPDAPAAGRGIGRTLVIQGEVTGEEDLTIDGRVEGKVSLKDHTLIVGPTGYLQAEVRARTVIVQGTVVGNIVADVKIEIATTGAVHGDVKAASVVLKENAQFRGNIDTGVDQGSDPPAESMEISDTIPPSIDLAGAKESLLKALDFDGPEKPKS